MTLRELADALGVSRNVAAKLAPKVPGAKREPRGPGQIPAWILPEDAFDYITEEMLEAARAEAAQAAPSTSAPSADPALLDEDRAVRRERLAADKARAEADRLRAEADRHKAEDELERLRDRQRGSRPDPGPLAADRFAALERKVEEAVRRPDVAATMAELLKAATAPLAPFIERLAAGPQPAPQPFGPTDLLGLAEKLRGLLGPPEGGLRREIRAAYRDGLEDGRERAGTGEGGRSWAEALSDIARALPDALRFGVQAGLIRPKTERLGAPPGGPTQGGEGGTPPMATVDPVFKEILDGLIEELGKPDGQRDIPGLAAFLETITLDPRTGQTLRDFMDPVARSPERLALIRLKLMDPRLIEATVLPGVRNLLTHLR
ncbi:MAG: hypothetical protein ACRD2T_12615, partial [Thermoanaerobaculia bacterium]